MNKTAGQSNLYVAKAVHFDGNTSLSRLYSADRPRVPPGDPLLPNSFTGIFSAWFRFGDAGQGQLFNNNGRGGWGSSGTPWVGTHDIGIGHELFTGKYAGQGSSELPNMANVWHHFIASWNTNYPRGQKIFSIYVDGTNVETPKTSMMDTSDAAPVQWSHFNEVESTVFVIPADVGTAQALDIADFQLWVEVFVDLSAPENLAKFISGGTPVNPAIAAVAFGRQTMLFSGDHTTFPVNQGTGGAFAVTGILTDASSHP
jgi:hypothetical protein